MLFRSIDVPVNAQTLTLPNNDKVRILAISAAEENPDITPAEPLFDTLSGTFSGASNPTFAQQTAH